MLALLLTAPSFADIYVGGDSLGVGVGYAGKAKSVADESVRITSNVPLKQIAKVPKGSTLFLSLGTNDAVGGVLKVQANVDAIISAASDRQIKVVWLGPPCVFKTWDKDAEALDGVLASLMATEGITYVSMRDDALCVKSLRAKDGVHFTMKGYRMMWDRAIAANGGVVEAEPTAPVEVAAASTRVASVRAAVPPAPRPMPSFRLGRLAFGAPFPVPLPAFRRPEV